MTNKQFDIIYPVCKFYTPDNGIKGCGNKNHPNYKVYAFLSTLNNSNCYCTKNKCPLLIINKQNESNR